MWPIGNIHKIAQIKDGIKSFSRNKSFDLKAFELFSLSFEPKEIK
jgi:hypothetical protein